MGTIIIKNLSTLDDTAALIRVGFHMNGDWNEAEQGGIVVRDDTDQRDEVAAIKRFFVLDKEE